jgi:hypothetical protein
MIIDGGAVVITCIDPAELPKLIAEALHSSSVKHITIDEVVDTEELMRKLVAIGRIKWKKEKRHEAHDRDRRAKHAIGLAQTERRHAQHPQPQASARDHRPVHRRRRRGRCISRRQ